LTSQKKCAPEGSGGGSQFMNCSWIIQLVHEHVHEHVQIFVTNIWIFPNSSTSFELVHEQFMNMFKKRK
jgi:hypothetical protein